MNPVDPAPQGKATRQTEFRDDQMRAVYSVGAENHFWPLARNRVVQRQMDRLLGRRKDLVVFDIGCGRGFTLAHLIKQGYTCYGSDLSDYAPEHPGATGRVFYKMDLDALPVSVRMETKLVLLLDVVEHLPHPEVLLRGLPAVFPGAQWLVVTVPARPELWSNYDEYYGHYRRYSPASLGELAKASGLQLQSWRYFFHGLYLPALLVKWLAGKRSTVVSVTKKSAFHEFVARLLYAEHAVIPGFIFGSSLLGVFALGKAPPKSDISGSNQGPMSSTPTFQ